ncbi:GNAT family N-acetyltransferase [Streptococcus ovis]|uniref:GNAT family N-acetyltransferase n=1 Tax=Streptococcus ovis TaxID=82806 RepID=UPI00037406CB|nr:GNAT family N-acetyltransferase [Streptococcus ovis]
MIRYQEEKKLEVAKVLPLYHAVGWTNYTENPDMLDQALQQSLYVLVAYDGQDVVGLLRAVGDGVSILFIQDILVLPSYQRQGIGRQLMDDVLEKYKNVYQLHLLTDQSEKIAAFYRALGFQPVEEIRCTAFTYVKRND